MNEIFIVAKDVEMLPLSSLLPRQNNPKNHSAEQVAMLAASIEEFGWTVPVLIDKDGALIAGHCRLLAAQKLGMKAVPCVRASHLNQTQIKALVIADNKLADAPWDEDVLREEIEGLKDLDVDLLGLTGFNFEELDEILDGSLAGDDTAEDDEEKVDFLVVGSHRIEISQSEKKELSAYFSKWAKDHGDYRGLVKEIIALMKTNYE